MPPSSLVDYIHEQTRDGISAHDIRVELLAAGWRELDIENGFRDVAAGLHPVTPGASIHEDLAQVRGMVAHLATRMKDLEATLASVATLPHQQSLPMQGQLPTAFIGADHELTARPAPSLARRAISLVIAALVFLQLAQYGAILVQRQSIAQQDYHVMVASFVALLVIAAALALRSRASWRATLLSASALILGGADLVFSWRVYHWIAAPAAAIGGIILLTTLMTLRRWGKRFAQ